MRNAEALSDSAGLRSLSGSRSSQYGQGLHIETRSSKLEIRFIAHAPQRVSGFDLRTLEFRFFEFRSPSGCSAPSDSAFLEEPFVVPHNQLGFYLLDRIHGHTYNNQQRSAAEVEVHIKT